MFLVGTLSLEKQLNNLSLCIGENWPQGAFIEFWYRLGCEPERGGTWGSIHTAHAEWSDQDAADSSGNCPATSCEDATA